MVTNRSFPFGLYRYARRGGPFFKIKKTYVRQGKLSHISLVISSKPDAHASCHDVDLERGQAAPTTPLRKTYYTKTARVNANEKSLCVLFDDMAAGLYTVCRQIKRGFWRDTIRGWVKKRPIRSRERRTQPSF